MSYIDEMLNSPAGGWFLIIIGILVVAAVGYLVFKGIKSIATFKLAKNRGINNAWMSFLPIAGNFVLGNIIDDINLINGKRTYQRFYFLGVSAILYLFYLLPFIGFAGHLKPGGIPLSQLPNYLYIAFLIFAIVKIGKDYGSNMNVVMGVITFFFVFAGPFYLLTLTKRVSISQCIKNGTPLPIGYNPQQQYNPYQPQYNPQQRQYNPQQQQYNPYQPQYNPQQPQYNPQQQQYNSQQPQYNPQQQQYNSQQPQYNPQQPQYNSQQPQYNPQQQQYNSQQSQIPNQYTSNDNKSFEKSPDDI